jgi:hypothetical protein
MDEPKIELPPWLPWATTACLAAAVACLVELWMIERARNQLLRDEGMLSESAMQGMGNQLEAERIISQRRIENLHPAQGTQGALRVALLAPASSGGGAAMGALAWNPQDGSGEIRISGLGGQPPQRDYQLWLEGPGPTPPARCAVFHADTGSGRAEIRVDPAAAAGPGGRFLLIDGIRDGSATLGEAKAGGSIVLATPLPAGRISN